MRSQGSQAHGRPWLGQLLSLALFLVAGVLFASVDGFPPSWTMLVAIEVVAVVVFLVVQRRERRWHEDLPNRIRRNDEAARNAEGTLRLSDEDQVQ